MKDIAAWTLIFMCVALAIIDGYLVLEQGHDASISARLRTIARNYPAVPFAAGALVAHLFGF